MPDLIGQSLGRYHILEPLGEGGMAAVYKAYDTRLERDVAVKVIRTDQFPPAALGRILKRFEREAKALARLSHPNIIGVIDYGEHEGSPYLVMQYLPGGNLKGYLRERGRMEWREAVRLLLPVAQALGFAHRRGIIHRDVKPSNILLTQNRQPMIADFGVVKMLEDGEEATLTGTGMGVGTPEYMAPEQWNGKSSPQSDIYSLGVVLYEMITGRKPYTADTPAAILLKQATEPPPRPSAYAPDLPEGVEELIRTALAKDPGGRYRSMEEFAEELERCLMDAVADHVRKPVTIASRRKGKSDAVESGESPAAGAATKKPESPIGTFQTRAGRAPAANASGRRALSSRGISLMITFLFAGAILSAAILAGGVLKLPANLHEASTPAAQPEGTSASTSQSTPKPTVSPSPGQTVMASPTGHGTPAITSNNADKIEKLTEWTVIEPVGALKFSPEGDILAVGLGNKTIQLWRLTDGKLLRTFDGTTETAFYLIFSPDGGMLASRHGSCLIKLWQISDGALLRNFGGENLCAEFIAFSPDSGILAASSDDGIFLWDVSTGRIVRTLAGRAHRYGDVVFSPDGSMIASGTEGENIIEIWRVSDGSPLRVIKLKEWIKMPGVQSLAFSPEGMVLAAGYADGSVRLWNASDGTLLETLEGHSIGVRNLAFSTDGTVLIAASDECEIIIWRVLDGIELISFKWGNYGDRRCFDLSPDGRLIASSPRYGVIYFWGISE